jgi:3-oxoadipate enol-lactonase
LPSETVYERGDGPIDGTPIVLSNSLGTTLSMWDPQAHALAAAGYRVLRYDTRGHGRSPVPPAPYTIDDLGGDLIGLLDRHGIERAHVAGVSMGGATAMWVAANAPDRVGRLVVCCSAARFGEPAQWFERAETVVEGGMAPVVESIAERWFTPRFTEEHPDVVVAVVHALGQIDPEGYAACCEAIGGIDLREAIAAVTAPTLVISGAQDSATPPSDGQLIAGTIPGARLEVLDPGAHLASIERHDAVTDLILEHLGGGR